MLVLDLPGPGAVKASATALREVVVKKHGRRIRKKVRFTFGTTHASAGAGALELTIKPSAAGRRALAAHRRLSVVIAVSFQPTGGKPATRKLTLALSRR